MPPEMRPVWAVRMSQLLSANGRLICVEFPTYKDPSTGGPPWGVNPSVYMGHLSKPGEKVEYDNDGYVVKEDSTTHNDKALFRVAHWQPQRTHEVGKGTDWVSLWAHAKVLA